MAAAVVSIGVAGTMAAHADGPPTLDVTVTHAATGSSSRPIDLDHLTYVDALEAFDDTQDDDEPSATLPVAPAGFPATGLDEARIHADDDLRSLAVVGPGEVFGLPVDVVVTAQWADAADASPDVAVIFSLGSTGLDELAPVDVPVQLAEAWIGVTTTDHRVEVDQLPAAAAALLGEGLDLQATGGGADGASAALNLVAVLDAGDGELAAAVSQLGLAGQARLEGVLAGSVGALGGDGPPAAGIGLDLSATFPTTGDAEIGGWFSPTGDWVLDVGADSDGNASVGFEGGADVTVGETVTAVDARLAVAWDGDEVTFELGADVGPVEDLFAQPWIDVAGLAVDARFTSAGDVEAGLSGTFDLAKLTGQDATAEVVLVLAAGSDGASGSFAVTTDVSVPLLDVSRSLAAGGTPDDLVAADLDGFTLGAAFDPDGVTAAVTAGVDVMVNDATITSDVLLRADAPSGGETGLVLAVRAADDAPDVTIGALLGADLGSADIVLPSFTIVASNADVAVGADELDTATAAYLGEGNDLDVARGAVIDADVVLPEALTAALAGAGVVTDDSLTLRGELPVLGGTTLGLAVQLPTLQASPDTPFRGGTLALQLRRESGVVKIGLAGTAEVGVPRSERDGCSGDTPPESCIDVLEFSVAADLVFDAGVRFELTGALTTTDGWRDPFGVTGLTIHDLALRVGVEVGGANPSPSVTVGMNGGLAVNGKDLRLSFLLGLTPSPPFVDPLGFTFASTAGFGVHDLVALYEMTSGDTVPGDVLPPDLRLEDVFLSFGTTDDTALCIRRGFFLHAELHLGGEAPVDENPPCEAPPLSPPEVTDACEAAESCLASLLIDIRTGSGSGAASSRVEASGYLAATDLGPLHFDPLTIELELSAATQRLYVSGGARLDDPLRPGTAWAAGAATLDFNRDSLYLAGSLDIGQDGEALHVAARGYGSLDLADPAFVLDLELSSRLLDAIAGDVEQAFDELASLVEHFDARLDDPGSPNFFRNLEVLLEETGEADPWLLAVVAELAEVQDTVAGINRTFTDAGLPPPVPAEEIIDIVFNGRSIGAFPGIPSVVVFDVCIGFDLESGCYLVPPVSFPSIPGLCDDPAFGGSYHGLLCGDLQREQLVGEVFADVLEDVLGLDLPAGTDGLDLLRGLDARLSGGGVTASCGASSVDYGTGTFGETELTMQIHGRTVVFDAPLVLSGDHVDPQGTVLQEGFDAIIGAGDGSSGRCTPTSTPPVVVIPAMTLSVEPGSVDEGEDVTARGTVDSTGSDAITIDWGDGTRSEADVVDGEFEATHTYADDLGAGSSNSLTVIARSGDASASARVTVHNVAPQVTTALDANRIDEGGTVSLTVDITDPGADDHVVDVSWSDGVSERVELDPGERTHTSTRTVEDDDPTATPSDELTATVRVTDDDGGEATETEVLTVDNVAPTSIDLTPVGLVVDGELRESDGPLVVDEGARLVWDLTFEDVGVRDFATVEIDWADGERERLVVPAAGELRRTRQVAHTYVDDDPSGSPSDTYEVEITVTDDDTGSTTSVVPVVVHNVDPTHAIDRTGTTTTSGGETFFTRVGDALTVTDRADDAGADDLRFDWDFGDGIGTSRWWRWDESAADIGLHPTDGVRGATDTVTHRYEQVCLRGLSVAVTDDDTGEAARDHVAVVVQGPVRDGARARNHGQWAAAIRRGEVSPSELRCHLDLAGHLSSVFVGGAEERGEVWAPTSGTVSITEYDRRGVPTVLTQAPGKDARGKLAIEQQKLDRSLLSAWLSFATGVWSWDTPIGDGDGDGVAELTFGELVTEVEQVRREVTDWKQVADARRRLWPLGAG